MRFPGLVIAYNNRENGTAPVHTEEIGPRDGFAMTFVYPVKNNDPHPAALSPDYKSPVKRAPQKPLIPMRHTLSELTGLVYGHETVRSGDADLTTPHKAEP